MGGSFYGFEMNYHSISGYGGSAYNAFDYRDRKYCDLERKGYAGFTVSDISPWELREIRRWIKKQPEHIYMSQVDNFETTDNDGYDDNCVCLWFSDPDRIDDFKSFLESLPKREFMVDLNEYVAEAKDAFAKLMRKGNKREVYRDNNLVTLCFDDDVEAMAFKLRWI